MEESLSIWVIHLIFSSVILFADLAFSFDFEAQTLFHSVSALVIFSKWQEFILSANQTFKAGKASC